MKKKRKKSLPHVFSCADETCLANREGLCFKYRIGNFECNSKQRKRAYFKRYKKLKEYEGD